MSSNIEFEANSSVIEQADNEVRNNGKVQKQEKKIIAPSKQKIITLVSALESHAEKKPNKTAVTFLKDGNNEEENITYQELDNRARIIAGYLQSQKIQSGDRALLIYPPGLEYISAFFGCLYAGVIAVPAYPPRQNHNLNRLASILKDVSARVVLTNEKLENQMKTNLHFHELFSNTKSQKFQFISTDKLTQENPLRELPDIKEESIAFIQYTSGSTSEPKGVVLTHRNLIHNIENHNQAMKMNGIDHSFNGCSVSWLPPYHDLGLITGILHPIYVHCSSVLMYPLTFLKNPITWFQAISNHKGTVCAAPNFAFDLCVDKISLENCQNISLNSLEQVGMGGESVRMDTINRFYSKFKEIGFKKKCFNPCYGLAESTLIVSSTLTNKKVKSVLVDKNYFKNNKIKVSVYKSKSMELVSSGIPFPNTEIKIVQPVRFTECQSMEIGEIWVRGESVAKGYFNKLEETVKTFNAFTSDSNEGPYLRTGDLGFLDKGELYVTGRLKELIIINGKNLYPQDLEIVIENSHPALVNNGSICFSINQENKEKLVIVSEVTREHKKYPAKSITSFIRKAIVENFEVEVESILLIKRGENPKTSSGKKQRLLCRQNFLKKNIFEIFRWDKPNQKDVYKLTLESTPNDENNLDFNLEEKIKQILSKRIQIPVQLIDSNKTFFDYGLDSLSLLSLAGEIEQEFSITLSVEALQGNPTINGVMDYLQKSNHNFENLSFDNQHNENKKTIDKISYHGGENFNLLESFSELKKMNFSNKLSYSSQFIDTSFEKTKLLYKREILSCIDREVIIKDPFTNKIKKMIMFGSNNYLGLANHPYIKNKVEKDVEKYGIGLASAPLLCGYTKLHKELEEKLSILKGTEDTLLYSSGYNANLGLISALINEKSVLICDEYSHASTIDGAKMSGNKVYYFKHNDLEDLERLIIHYSKNNFDVFVSVEGLYSMDGDIPPLDKIVKLCKKYKALLIVDDAHATGVLGETGKGSSEHFYLKNIDITLGTFSKTFTINGGFVSSTSAIINYLRSFSRSYLFSASVSIYAVSTALACLEMLKKQPELRIKLRKNIKYFIEGLNAIGINTAKFDLNSPIIALSVPSFKNIHDISLKFHEKGFFLNSIYYPAVPIGKERFRISIMSTHTLEDLNKLLDQIETVYFN